MERDQLEIYVRHTTEERWCNYRGDWLPRRESAISFSSSVDALQFCRAFHVEGILVTFAPTGLEMCRVSVVALLGTRLTADVQARSLARGHSS